MKKHTEGYVMIYVLVVMVLLALVATGVLSVSLNNYKAQQAVGQQMQELYTAEGIAEQVTATLKNQSFSAFYSDEIEPEPVGDAFVVDYGPLLLSCIDAAALEYANRVDKTILGIDVTGRSLVPVEEWTHSVARFYISGEDDDPLSFYERDLLGELIVCSYLPLGVDSDPADRTFVDNLISARASAIYSDLTFEADADPSDNCISYKAAIPYYAEVKGGASDICVKYLVSYLITAMVTNEDTIEEEGKTVIQYTLTYGISDVDVQYVSYEIKSGVAS